MASKKRYKYTTVRQWGGDDGYQWSVFVKGDWDDKPRICGLTRSEVSYYRDKIEKSEAEKREAKS